MAVEKGGGQLGRALAVGTALALGLFILPGLVVEQLEDPAGAAGPVTPVVQQEGSAAQASRDQGRMVHLLRGDGQVEELTMEEYLWGVVAAEMPAGFEPEALKAQAAAARTYAVQVQDAPDPKHPQGQLCDSSSCCQAYVDRDTAMVRWGVQSGQYAQKISQAVEQTDGLGVLYRDEPIQAVFFSCASGRTVDAAQVWGTPVDYLRGVESPEGNEVPNYRTQVVLSVEQVRTAVLQACPDADLTSDPALWFTEGIYNSAGGVTQMKVGGIPLSGTQLRSLFSLRSASFTVRLQGEQFVFDVVGYGHGVGMSQYGANAMAGEGATFREILTWYYTGTQVDYLWE